MANRALERVFVTVEEALAAGVPLAAIRAAGIKPPEIEDVLRDPVKWNADWERASHFTPISWYQREVQDQSFLNKAMLDARYLAYPSLASTTLTLQIGLVHEIRAILHLFDDKWLLADPAVRAKHMLVGLTTSCSAAHNLHFARRLCPTELSLSRHRRDGKYLIVLLKALLPEDPTASPTEVKHFAHPDWDTLREYYERSNPSDVDKLCYQEMLILRTKLICYVLHATFRSFLGLDVNQIRVQKVHAQEKKLDSPEKWNLPAPPGATFARTGCQSKTCPNGMDTAAEVPKDKQFLRCKQCWITFKREVKYCDRECQKADWKPNHRAICGKPLNFDTINEIARATPISIRFAPAAPGFTRSTALSYLISQLCHMPAADYMILRMPATSRAVGMMTHALCWWAALLRPAACGPITADIVVEQIRVEFSFDEKASVINLQERHLTDPFQRPPFLWNMDPTAWMSFQAKYKIVQKRIKFADP
ncbi:hypothetical protein FB451DRAFT_1277306 [Mycena latifolia]|nr:hypothetical protein FB451DRAFT_1277306 [Mycena latifolia]